MYNKKVLHVGYIPRLWYLKQVKISIIHRIVVCSYIC